MSYTKHTWTKGENITLNNLNNIETGVETLDTEKLDKVNPTGTGYLALNANGTPGEKAVAIGSYTTASGAASFAEGSNTKAESSFAHAEGYSTTASAEAAHAEGQSTTASGSYSHAEGQSTTASSITSHAEGESTTASGMRSHAEGKGTTASNDCSHAEGNSTKASGTASHAEGGFTVASGSYSHAEGNNTISGAYQHVSGQYNIADSSVKQGRLSQSTVSYVSGQSIYTFSSATYENRIETIYIYYILSEKEYRIILSKDDGDYTYTFDSSSFTGTLTINKEITLPSGATNSLIVLLKRELSSQDYKYAEIIGNGVETWRRNIQALDWYGNGYYAGDIYVNCENDLTGGTKIATVDDIVDPLIVEATGTYSTSDTIPLTFTTPLADTIAAINAGKPVVAKVGLTIPEYGTFYFYANSTFNSDASEEPMFFAVDGGTIYTFTQTSDTEGELQIKELVSETQIDNLWDQVDENESNINTLRTSINNKQDRFTIVKFLAYLNGGVQASLTPSEVLNTYGITSVIGLLKVPNASDDTLGIYSDPCVKQYDSSTSSNEIVFKFIDNDDNKMTIITGNISTDTWTVKEECIDISDNPYLKSWDDIKQVLNIANDDEGILRHFFKIGDIINTRMGRLKVVGLNYDSNVTTGTPKATVDLQYIDAIGYGVFQGYFKDGSRKLCINNYKDSPIHAWLNSSKENWQEDYTPNRFGTETIHDYCVNNLWSGTGFKKYLEIKDPELLSLLQDQEVLVKTYVSDLGSSSGTPIIIVEAGEYIFRNDTVWKCITQSVGLLDLSKFEDQSITEFNQSTSYSIGNKCYYSQAIWTCTQAHTGAWNASHFERDTSCDYTVTAQVVLPSRSELFAVDSDSIEYEGVALEDYSINHTFTGTNPSDVIDGNRVMFYTDDQPETFYTRSRDVDGKGYVATIANDGSVQSSIETDYQCSIAPRIRIGYVKS